MAVYFFSNNSGQALIDCPHRKVIKLNRFNEAAALLPIRLNSELLILPQRMRDSAEEIRLRAGQPLTVLVNGVEHQVIPDHRVAAEELESTLECATGASVHAVESGMANGFVSVSGGIRLGICGTAVMHGDKLHCIRNLSSIAIRIPHEVHNCGDDEFNKITEPGIDNTLIVSPPGGGKTTLIRDYIRRISDSGLRVSVADERGEIAAVYCGEPQFDIGSHTDVLSSAPKAESAMMLIRAMNPQVLAMDEISAEEDIKAIETAVGCGVKVIATAHGESVMELNKRPVYKRLMDMQVFRYAVIIENFRGDRKYRLEELQ